MAPTWNPGNLANHCHKRNMDIQSKHCVEESWLEAHCVKYPISELDFENLTLKVHRDHRVAFSACMVTKHSNGKSWQPSNCLYKFDLGGYMAITDNKDIHFISLYHIHYARPKNEEPKYSTYGPCSNCLDEEALVIRVKNFLLCKEQFRTLYDFKNIKKMEAFKFSKKISNTYLKP
jgi:hypothetical protein